MEWSENDRYVVKYLKAFRGFSIFLIIFGCLGLSFGLYLILYGDIGECSRLNYSLAGFSFGFTIQGYLLWHAYSLIDKLLKDNSQNGL